MYYIDYQGKQIPYEVQRNKIKNCYIHIKQGKVIVRVPARLRQDEIEKLVIEKAKWIKNKLEKIQDQKENNSFIFLGKAYEIQVQWEEARDMPSWKLTKEALEIQLPKTTQQQEQDSLQQQIDSIYMQLAQTMIPSLMETVTEKTNLSANQIRFKKLKSIWGSCNRKKEITFNIYLVKYPIQVICYVILHELCHTVQMNHSNQFWSLVQQYMPEYKQVKKLLK